jgi:tetraacyldisaccharide 4'-kinase
VNVALAPLAAAYGAAVSARLALYRRGILKTAHAKRPVISVGNLAVGGTGKTPFVAWLARELAAAGEKPSILTRGYGRSGSGTVVVADGAGHRTDVSLSGDEAAVLAQALPDVPIVAAARRAEAAERAESLFPAVTLHLLDDGFSHVALSREVDVVLLDATDPAARGALLPAGRLREPLSSLGRADVVVVTKVEQADPGPALELARRHAPGAPLYRAETVVEAIRDAHGDEVAPKDLPAGTVVAVAGIARPEAFRFTLESLGVEPTAFLSFPDHADYGPYRVGKILRAVEETGATAVVTTEKDAVKLSSVLSLPIFRVGILMRVKEARFAADLLARLARRPS